MRQITEIVVHCTATRPDWWATRSTAQKVDEVRRWHVEDRGWKDIGYHFLIDRNGKVATGRPLERVGAHVIGHNQGTIGVALFGGHGGATTDAFADHFTPEQDAALRNLLMDLQTRFPAITKISGHHEYAAKACPCFGVSAWLKSGPQKPVKPRAPQPTPKPEAPATAPNHGLWQAIAAALSALLKGSRK
jgi:hypothetical protein